MDKRIAEKFFYEKRVYKILRYIAYVFMSFGGFSYIFLWSGVEIGTPFLVAGIIIFWVVRSKTVNGKDYLLQAESVIDEEIINLQNKLSIKEKQNGSVITSKQYVISPDFCVKKAAKNKLVSNYAQAVVIYCNDKVNRFHVLATIFDFVGGTKEDIYFSGCLSDLQLTRKEITCIHFGCTQKQLSINMIFEDKKLELILNDDYPTNKFIDDYFVNRRCE